MTIARRPAAVILLGLFIVIGGGYSIASKKDAPTPTTPTGMLTSTLDGAPAQSPAAPNASPALRAETDFDGRPAHFTALVKTKDVTFDTIKFKMKKTERFKRSMLTEEIEELQGQTIRIRGYMLPSYQQNGIKQFVLVRDNMECCFGPGAALFDCIIVEMEGDKTTSFSVRSITVEGEFSVKPYKGIDGKLLAIYHMVGVKVDS